MSDDTLRPDESIERYLVTIAGSADWCPGFVAHDLVDARDRAVVRVQLARVCGFGASLLSVSPEAIPA